MGRYTWDRYDIISLLILQYKVQETNRRKGWWWWSFLRSW